MNREIKFRVFNKRRKQFEKLFPQDQNNLNELYGSPFSNLVCALSSIKRDDELVLQQFTGSQDKNGRDIYEGDVIKQLNGRIGAVQWITEEEGWDYTGWHMQNAHWGDGVSETEVIGNIFEGEKL